MNRYLSLLITLLFVTTANKSYSSFHRKADSPSSLQISVKYLNASEFVKLSPAQFVKLTGRKMNIADRIFFKIAKLRMKHDLRNNPNLRVTDYYAFSRKSSATNIVKWVLIGIALFFILFLLVIGIASKK